MNMMKNKVAVVTGASRGIGEAAARHLARLGAKVAIAARSADHIQQIAANIRTADGTAIAGAGDISRFENVADLIATTIKQFGQIDLLVNNGGSSIRLVALLTGIRILGRMLLM